MFISSSDVWNWMIEEVFADIKDIIIFFNNKVAMKRLILPLWNVSLMFQSTCIERLRQATGTR